MDERLPLSALLSQALVAYTMEFDNEAEHRMPHSTTDHGSIANALHAPWLVSMVMWWNCMRFVSDEGVTVRELHRLARTTTNLDGMRRWGYIRITPDTTFSKSKRPRPDAVLRPTTAGRMAQEIWCPMLAVIEKRWEERFGKDAVDRLRDALERLVTQLNAELPDCMPILHHGMATPRPDPQLRAAAKDAEKLPLAALLARATVAVALEFERESEISLAICANVLRVIGDAGARVRDLPRLSGVSKEAIAMVLGFLEKRGCAAVNPESGGSRIKAVVLSRQGREARDAYGPLTRAIEEQWLARFGEDVVHALRDVLEGLGAGARAEGSRLFDGLKPYTDGWRASLPTPEILPHYPMVLHRGGFPDGS